MTLLKTAVLALLLANVGYFLWARDLAESDSLTMAGTASTLPAIKLASEMQQSSADGINVTVVGTGAAADAAATRPPGADASSDEQSAQLLTNVKRCVSVGPFRDVSETARAATTLRASGYGPRQRVAEGEVWAGVWVYLPRPDAPLAGDELLARLKKGGIDDALEMPGPSDAPVVSLGLFSEAKRAQARVVQAQRLGLKPLVMDRKRSGNVFWVDIDLKTTDGLLNPSDLQGEAGRITRLEVKACPAPAPAPAAP